MELCGFVGGEHKLSTSLSVPADLEKRVNEQHWTVLAALAVVRGKVTLQEKEAIQLGYMMDCSIYGGDVRFTPDKWRKAVYTVHQMPGS